MSESLYGDHIKDRICELLMQGRSLRSICSEPGMPAASTVCLWALNPNGENDQFAEQYRRARSIQADGFAEEVIEIADSASPEDAAAARLRFDARRWYVSKVLPKKYGEKLDLTSGGEKLQGTNILKVMTQAELDDLESRISQNS